MEGGWITVTVVSDHLILGSYLMQGVLHDIYIHQDEMHVTKFERGIEEYANLHPEAWATVQNMIANSAALRSERNEMDGAKTSINEANESWTPDSDGKVNPNGKRTLGQTLLPTSYNPIPWYKGT
jgi:hypothetical protein